MEAALRLQRRLAATVDTGARLARVRLVAGADAAYHQDGERLVAAVVVIALPGLEVVEQASAEGWVTFPYVGCAKSRLAGEHGPVAARRQFSRMAMLRSSPQSWMTLFRR